MLGIYGGLLEEEAAHRALLRERSELRVEPPSAAGGSRDGEEEGEELGGGAVAATLDLLARGRLLVLLALCSPACCSSLGLLRVRRVSAKLVDNLKCLGGLTWSLLASALQQARWSWRWRPT